MSRRMSRNWLLGVAVSLGLAAPALAQDSNLLEEARRREQVAAQALERDLQAALATADKLKDNPAKAAEVLRKALAELDGESVLTPARRQALLTSLRDKLKAVEATGTKPAAAPAKPAPDNAPALSDEATKRDLAIIQALRKEGKYTEAARLSEELAKRQAASAAVEASRTTGSRAEATRENDHSTASAANARNKISQGTLKDGIPIAGDVSYPPGWRDKMDARLKKDPGQVKLTAKEKEILKTLDEVTAVPIQLKDVPFEEIVKWLQKETALPIVVNKPALDDQKISYETTLSVNLPRAISKRSLLRSILGELGLTYVVKNETVEITSQIKAQSEHVTRIFRIDDLGSVVVGQGGVGTPTNVQDLMEMIIATVEPTSWAKNGGTGTITYVPSARALVVKNSAEVIGRLAGGSR